jgi:hypothetical protein
MKRLAIIWTLLLIPIILMAQIPIEDVSYKAFRVDIYIQGETHAFSCNDIFYIKDNKMVSTLNNQAKRVYFQEKPAYQDIKTYNDNLHAASKDLGGFKCQFYLVYTPADKTTSKEKDVYSIIIYYSNVMFNFQCHLTDEKPWFMNEDPSDYLIEEGKQYVENPNYTQEEIDAFLSQIGDPAKIMAIIMASFYQDLMNY